MIQLLQTPDKHTQQGSTKNQGVSAPSYLAAIASLNQFHKWYIDELLQPYVAKEATHHINWFRKPNRNVETT